MKKHVLSLLGVLMALPMLAIDFSFEYKGNTLNYTTQNDNEVSVYRSGNLSGDLVIPAKVTYQGKEYTVTSILGSAFSGSKEITSVTIPETITSIGSYAFGSCSGLTFAQFASIESLCKIQFGFDTSNPLYYAHNLWIDGKEVKDLVIPETVTSIGKSAFIYCTGLNSVTIGNSVTSIGDRAFKDCWGFTSLTLGNSVTSIGEQAFWEGRSLTSVSIPNSVTSIGENAFSGCRSLKSTEFASLESLCKIEFGNSLSNPLHYTHNLLIDGKEVKELVIPETVTSIGNYAFIQCTGLTSVTIPNSVTSIGSYAFSDCQKITSVNIPNSVTSIGSHAFSKCEKITSVTIPSSVTSINDNTFFACSSLTSITIPPSVTSIGGEAFSGCSSLISIDIPDAVTSIGMGAFSWCRSLSSVIIPNSVTSIGSSAFVGCYGLNSVTIGCKVTDIYDNAFNTPSLNIVNCYAMTPPTCGTGVFNASNQPNMTLNVPVGTKELYANAKVWEDFFRINDELPVIDGIEQVIEDFEEAPVEVYDLKGILVKPADKHELNALPHGIYIIRQHSAIKKIAIK